MIDGSQAGETRQQAILLVAGSFSFLWVFRGKPWQSVAADDRQHRQAWQLPRWAAGRHHSKRTRPHPCPDTCAPTPAHAHLPAPAPACACAHTTRTRPRARTRTPARRRPPMRTCPRPRLPAPARTRRAHARAPAPGHLRADARPCAPARARACLRLRAHDARPPARRYCAHARDLKRVRKREIFLGLRVFFSFREPGERKKEGG
jgi:hypothetical protein